MKYTEVQEIVGGFAVDKIKGEKLNLTILFNFQVSKINIRLFLVVGSFLKITI